MKLLIIVPPNECSKHNLSIQTMFLYYIEIDLLQEKSTRTLKPSVLLIIFTHCSATSCKKRRSLRPVRLCNLLVLLFMLPVFLLSERHRAFFPKPGAHCTRIMITVIFVQSCSSSFMCEHSCHSFSLSHSRTITLDFSIITSAHRLLISILLLLLLLIVPVLLAVGCLY